MRKIHRMPSEGSNFFCGCAHGADPLHSHMSTWAWPPPCGHHKWMAWTCVMCHTMVKVTITLFTLQHLHSVHSRKQYILCISYRNSSFYCNRIYAMQLWQTFLKNIWLSSLIYIISNLFIVMISSFKFCKQSSLSQTWMALTLTVSACSRSYWKNNRPHH